MMKYNLATIAICWLFERFDASNKVFGFLVPKIRLTFPLVVPQLKDLKYHTFCS